MRIATISLKNWLCFRGEHEIQLEAKPYAVCARKEDDADRSNYLGKSSLLEAVDFAFYGRHRQRLEDDWITRGEAEGEVQIRFDDGSVVKRSRQLGKATQMTFGDARQDEAQSALDAYLGLSSEDFEATCFFRQKQMAKMIIATPEERMATVSAWLRLDLLRQAEEIARSRALRFEASAKANTATPPPGAALAPEEYVRLRGQLAQAQADLEAATERLANVENVVKGNEYFVVQKERRVLRAACDAVVVPDNPSEELANAKAILAEAQQAHRDACAIARGEFDGTCPVAGIVCPATAEINKQGKVAVERRTKAEERLALAGVRHREAKDRAVTFQTLWEEQTRGNAKLVELRLRSERLAAFKDHAGEVPESPREALRMAQDRVSFAERALSQATAQDALVAQQSKQYEESRKRAEDALGQARAYRAAVQVFGRTGAQRLVAERTLAGIEQEANRSLSDAGIDLSLRVIWAREGKGLAKDCDACGAVFPASLRVKACERCGAERGPAIQSRLDVELSDRSGAAEDLAGIALQLAASAWLRRSRNVPFETAFLDEPMAAVDRAYRRTLGGKFASILQGSGFRQAFVIAHDEQALAALPGRIQIIGGLNGSRLEVVA